MAEPKLSAFILIRFSDNSNLTYLCPFYSLASSNSNCNLFWGNNYAFLPDVTSGGNSWSGMSIGLCYLPLQPQFQNLPWYV